jgi:hypothetical protein
MSYVCGVSKKFGEWYQKTNKTEDTNKLTLLAFKLIAILHNTLLATFIKLLETVSKGHFRNRSQNRCHTFLDCRRMESRFWGAENSPSSASLCDNQSCIAQGSRVRTWRSRMCWQNWPVLCQTVVTVDLRILSIGVDNNPWGQYQPLIPTGFVEGYEVREGSRKVECVAEIWRWGLHEACRRLNFKGRD